MDNVKKLIDEELTKVYPQLLINVEKVCGDNIEWREDLLPVTIEMFLKMDPLKQLKIVQEGKLEHYITRSMKLQLVWKSDFNKYYRRKEKSREFYINIQYPGTVDMDFENYGEPDLQPEELAIECMLRIVSQYDPFLKEIANKILLGNETLRTLSRKYGINYYSMKAGINAIRQDLRIHCNYCFNEEYLPKQLQL